MRDDGIVLGIDLGATNSTACIYRDGEFEIIPSALGNDSFPSVVAVSKNGELLVGQFAQKQMLTNPENTVANVKLRMGTNELIRFNGEDLRPQEISALILAHIKRDAETYLGKPIKNAVISVPTSFDDDARNATIEAGQIAGFEVETIVNEPTAACLAYATIKDIRGNILVFDIGGGTLDITIGSFDGDELVPQSTVGYRVGGRNITRALFDYVQNEFEEINGLKLEDYVTPDYDPLVALYDAVETAKIELSSTKTTKIYIPSIVVTDEGERINLDMEVHRSKLNELSDFVIERSEQGIADALSGANLTKEDIDYLVFVGDSNNVSIIKESVEKTLGLSAVEGIDPSLCVVQGASLYRTGPVTILTKNNKTNTNYGNQTYAKIELIEDEFKYAGYDKKLIEDLSSKFNGLTIDDKEALIKIMGFFKNSDLCFKDFQDLIRENVLEGNMSIDSFYKNRENIVKSRINENNRKIKRNLEKQLIIERNKKIKEKKQFENSNVELNKMIVEKLKNEKQKLNKSYDLLFDEYYDLKKENEQLKAEKVKLYKENGELSNQINNISADKSDNTWIDNNLYFFGEDFKYANSLNMISGIYHEDYKKDLEVIVSNSDILEEECIIFGSAFDEYDAGNFYEAYEIFNKFSGNFKWPQEYINFLKATSLSSDNKFKEACVLIDRGHIRELRKKYNEDKYPILWFNFGNIYFDYAISQSGIKALNAFKLANFCYKNAKYIVSEKKFRQEPKSNYKFIFKDEMSKEDFENNVQMMYMRTEICNSLLRIERLKDEIERLKDKKEK